MCKRDVTRDITWCIDRCAASMRAIPTFLPTSNTTPFPHIPSAVTRFLPRLFFSPSPFTRFSPSYFFSHSRAIIFHRPPLLQQISPPFRAPPRPSWQNPVRHLSCRVSSELIIKCIIVPVGLPSLLYNRLFTLVGLCEVSPYHSRLPPQKETRHGSSRIFDAALSWSASLTSKRL